MYWSLAIADKKNILFCARIEVFLPPVTTNLTETAFSSLPGQPQGV